MWLGTISYGLYVIHQILFQVLGEVAHAHGISVRPVWLFVPAILASLLFALLSYSWIEEPILRWKSQCPYGRTIEADGPLRVAEGGRRWCQSPATIGVYRDNRLACRSRIRR